MFVTKHTTRVFDSPYPSVRLFKDDEKKKTETVETSRPPVQRHIEKTGVFITFHATMPHICIYAVKITQEYAII